MEHLCCPANHLDRLGPTRRHLHVLRLEQSYREVGSGSSHGTAGLPGFVGLRLQQDCQALGPLHPVPGRHRVPAALHLLWLLPRLHQALWACNTARDSLGKQRWRRCGQQLPYDTAALVRLTPARLVNNKVQTAESSLFRGRRIRWPRPTTRLPSPRPTINETPHSTTDDILFFYMFPIPSAPSHKISFNRTTEEMFPQWLPHYPHRGCCT